MQSIDQILTKTIRDPVGPEFMAPTEVPAKYLSKNTKVGDRITIVNKFPVVSWKAKKLTSLLGVGLP